MKRLMFRGLKVFVKLTLGDLECDGALSLLRALVEEGCVGTALRDRQRESGHLRIQIC